MKRLLAALACVATLCPPCFASDWVEEGSVETDKEMAPALLPMSVNVPSQEIQEPEISDEALNLDWAEFTPGYIPSFAYDKRDLAIIAPQTLKVSSLLLALADTESLASLSLLGSDVTPEFRMDRLEQTCGQQTSNGNVRDRLIVLRKRMKWPAILKNRRSLPDDIINALGRGVTSGVKASVKTGGNLLVEAPLSLVKNTAQALSTPGVPELLLAGAILGIGIPLAIQASKHNSGFPFSFGFTNPYFVPSYSPVYSNSFGSSPTLISSPGSNTPISPFGMQPMSFMQPIQPFPMQSIQPIQSSYSYSSPGYHWVNGYTTSGGVYRQGHFQTNSDGNFFNNWSTVGNTNPFTGMSGTKRFPSRWP